MKNTSQRKELLKTLPFVACITALAWVVHQLPFPPFTLESGHLKHPIGVSAMAILLGITTANLFPKLKLSYGCRWITTWCIPFAIVFLGMRMDLTMLAEIGWQLLFAIIGIMVFAVALTYGIGRAFGMSPRSASLLGIGTAVCGSSAILATAPVAGADDEEVLVTVGAVNLIGLLAMFSCIALLWFIPLSAGVYGAWAGATIHAVPQVIAAAESHSMDAAVMGTLVKLTRVTMLAPIVLITALIAAKHTKKSSSSPVKNKRKIWQYVPWFIWGFIGLASFRALGWIPQLTFQPDSQHAFTIDLSIILPTIAKWLLAYSMTAIGLQVHIRSMLKAGSKALFAGTLSWIIMSISTLFLFLYLKP